MARILILRLQGVLQSWGGHTFETFRPTELFPTRSGLTGMLAACLGIRRNQPDRLAALSSSYLYAARSESGEGRPDRMEDFHTVNQVRTVGGTTLKPTEITRRQYLEDTRFTVVLRFHPGGVFGLDQVVGAVRTPGLMPYLGRKSCPLGRPLFEAVVDADSLHEALLSVPPGKGTVYSEEPGQGVSSMRVRDMPVYGGPRTFETRTVYIYPMEGVPCI